MAIGDRIPTELCQTLLSTTATNYFTNTSTNRTQLTGIFAVNTGATQRTVTLYKNGLSAVNQIANSIVLPANSSSWLPLGGMSLVFTGTQTFGAKQDVGTDVTITAVGIVEQIA